jgi:hypothetical protein
MNKRILAVQLIANRGPGMAYLELQHQPRPAHVIGTPAAARRPLVEFLTFRIGQYDGFLHECHPTTVSAVTVRQSRTVKAARKLFRYGKGEWPEGNLFRHAPE